MSRNFPLPTGKHCWCRKNSNTHLQNVKHVSAYNSQQMAFPQDPFHNEPLLSVNKELLQILGKKDETCEVLAEENATFSNVFDSTFTDNIVRHGKQGWQKKPSANECLRLIYRNFRDSENKSLTKATSISVLTEDESLKVYQRKRNRQHFDTPPAKRSNVKSHSPDFSSVTWDTDEVCMTYNTTHQHHLSSTGPLLPRNTTFLVKMPVRSLRNLQPSLE